MMMMMMNAASILCIKMQLLPNKTIYGKFVYTKNIHPLLNYLHLKTPALTSYTLLSPSITFRCFTLSLKLVYSENIFLHHI